MSNNEELLRDADMEDIAKRGAQIYEQKKNEFSPEQQGKFLAIEVNSGDTYIADVSSEAVEKARAAHPGTVFYVVRIGHSAAETLASMGSYDRGQHHR